jgi:hypothetical protein
VPPFVSSLRLVALMIFIALVAVAVWLADLRLAIALPLVGLAWLIAATIEWLAWRSARGPAAVVETTQVAPQAPAPPVAAEAVAPEPEPVPDLVPPPAPEPEAVEEPEPQPEAVAPPESQPERVAEAAAEPVPKPEPEPEPEPEGVPEPVAEAVEAGPVVAETVVIAEAERSPRWSRRRRLRAVPPPPPEPAAAPAPPRVAESQVVSLPQRTYHPRQWNLWDLERLARAEAPKHPERRDEWAFLFVHLRQFANADGELPTEFDSLVRESFGSLLDRQPIR